MTTEAQPAVSSPIEALRYAHATDIGRRREENQDSYGSIENERFRLFFVADGMGGVKGGAVASQLAVATLKEALTNAPELTVEAMCNAVGQANNAIFQSGTQESGLAGMGTTLVALGFTGTTMLVTNVGDSRAYRIRGNVIEQLTQDHTLVMELVRSGTITLEQAGNHPVSHMLTRSLGPTPSIDVDCWALQDGPARGDVYLMCSDGLYNLVGPEEFVEIVQSCSLSDAVLELIDLANLRGGTDNITVIAVEVGEQYPVGPEEFADTVELTEVLNGNAQTGGENGTHAATPNGTAEGGTAQAGAAPLAVLVGSSEAQEKGTGSVGSGSIPLEKFSRAPGTQSDDEVEKEEEEADESGDSKPQEGISSEQGEVQSSESSVDDAQTDGMAATGPAVATGESAASESIPGSATTSVQVTSRLPLILAFCAVAVVGGAIGSLLSRGAGGGSTPRGNLTELVTAPRVIAPEVARVEPADSQRTELGKGSRLRLPSLSEGTDKPMMHPNSAVVAHLDGENSHGTLSSEELARVLRRRDGLRATVKDLDDKIESFEKPFSGKAGQILQDASQRSDQLRAELAQVRADIDIATRKLAVWFGRRKRLLTTEAVNLANEVAVSSTLVKEKKEAFERATWAYLKEAEVLKYNPSDRTQEGKVDQLIALRRDTMRELAEEVRRAIDKEVGDADRHISELTLRRDQIDSELENLRKEVEYVKVLTGSDAQAREQKKREIVREREIASSELDELTSLLPEHAGEEGVGK